MFHELINTFKVVSTFIAHLVAFWVNSMVESAHSVGAIFNVTAGFVRFVRLIYMLLKVNLIYELLVTCST